MGDRLLQMGDRLPRRDITAYLVLEGRDIRSVALVLIHVTVVLVFLRDLGSK